MGDRLDPGAGRGEVGVARVEAVVHRVVADLVALGEDLSHRGLAPRHLLTDLEEGAVDVLVAQHPQEARRVGAGAVVEGERDDLAPPRPVGVQPRGAARAADLADGAQAEGPVARGGDAVDGAGDPGRLAAAAGQRPPAVAPRRKAGLRRRQRYDQLVRARPPHERGQRVPADRLARGVDRTEADPPVGVGSAQAQPPLAQRAGRAERHAEVGPVGDGGDGGERVEAGERNRRRGADREDEALPGLGQARPQQVGSRAAVRIPSPGRIGGSRQRGQGERGDAQGLARACDDWFQAST